MLTFLWNDGFPCWSPLVGGHGQSSLSLGKGATKREGRQLRRISCWLDSVSILLLLETPFLYNVENAQSFVTGNPFTMTILHTFLFPILAQRDKEPSGLFLALGAGAMLNGLTDHCKGRV